MQFNSPYLAGLSVADQYELFKNDKSADALQLTLENFASVIDFIDGKVAITYVVAAKYSQILFLSDDGSTI
jgi:hypothetical protein